MKEDPEHYLDEYEYGKLHPEYRENLKRMVAKLWEKETGEKVNPDDILGRSSMTN